MGFGPKMEVTTRTGEQVVLDAITREQARAIPPYWTEEVSRYLGNPVSNMTPELEDGWYDKISTSDEHVIWGIFIREGGELVHIGNSGLHNIKDGSATSGVIIFRPEHWGRGIVGAAHLARIRIAIEKLRLQAIRSEVMRPNQGSAKALQRVGYAWVGTDHAKMSDNGQPIPADQFIWVNPMHEVSDFFWGQDYPWTDEEKARFATAEAMALTAYTKSLTCTRYAEGPKPTLWTPNGHRSVEVTPG